MIGLPEMQLQAVPFCYFTLRRYYVSPRNGTMKDVGFEEKRFAVEYVVFFKACVVFPDLSS